MLTRKSFHLRSKLTVTLPPELPPSPEALFTNLKSTHPRSDFRYLREAQALRAAGPVCTRTGATGVVWGAGAPLRIADAEPMANIDAVRTAAASLSIDPS